MKLRTAMTESPNEYVTEKINEIVEKYRSDPKAYVTDISGFLYSNRNNDIAFVSAEYYQLIKDTIDHDWPGYTYITIEDFKPSHSPW